MKTYKGKAGSTLVYVHQDDAETYVLSQRQDLYNHSPDGFAWGYGGSGPAQLALAILADHTGDDELALTHYLNFKRDAIATEIMNDNFLMHEAVVERWLETVGGV